MNKLYRLGNRLGVSAPEREAVSSGELCFSLLWRLGLGQVADEDVGGVSPFILRAW